MHLYRLTANLTILLDGTKHSGLFSNSVRQRREILTGDDYLVVGCPRLRICVKTSLKVGAMPSSTLLHLRASRFIKKFPQKHVHMCNSRCNTLLCVKYSPLPTAIAAIINNICTQICLFPRIAIVGCVILPTSQPENKECMLQQKTHES